jgi:hypothetical protein
MAKLSKRNYVRLTAAKCSYEKTNLSACSYWIISIKWWISNEHLIHDSAQGPPENKIEYNRY